MAEAEATPAAGHVAFAPEDASNPASDASRQQQQQQLLDRQKSSVGEGKAAARRGRADQRSPQQSHSSSRSTKEQRVVATLLAEELRATEEVLGHLCAQVRPLSPLPLYPRKPHARGISFHLPATVAPSHSTRDLRSPPFLLAPCHLT